jgi:hypothetical protein
MFSLSTLDVGVGVTLLFLFMSLIATAFRELVEACLKTRARQLDRGIRELLADPKSRQAVTDFYQHPLINPLYKDDYRPGGRNLPSYIPRESFSLAVLDLAAAASQSSAPLSIASLEASLPADPNPVQRVVKLALVTADGDIQKARDTLEGWFDSTMDRVSGWYTRGTSWILFAFGFAGAVLFNVDAITIAERLATHQDLRAAVVTVAEKIETDPSFRAGIGVDQPAPGATDTRASAVPSVGDAKDELVARIAHIRDAFDGLTLPIGWASDDKRGGLYPRPQMCRAGVSGDESRLACGFTWRDAITTLIGWFVTALAITLGAPFWFDILSKLMVVRSTIRPEEKSGQKSGDVAAAQPKKT